MANKNNVKNIILVSGAVVAASFAVMGVVAKKKKGDSVYENKPEEKNPFEGKKVRFVEDEADAENADGVKGHLEEIGEAEYRGSLYDKYGKRTLDIFLSGMGLIILSPVFLGISVAIKIDDPGPVLFTQKRVGKNKQYFKLHKFRSMKMSTPHDVPTHMLDNPESYITKVGEFLRKHSLDELPQIWDIFIGNMSVIGPRPALWNQDVLTAERDKYGVNEIKPGLTGWAQINGRDELEIVDKAKLDGEYVEKEGPVMDLKCFLGSLGVFGGDSSVVEGGTGEIHKEQKEKVAEAPTVDIIAEKTVSVVLPEHINVLIAGKGSYIGTTVRNYLLQDSRYSVTELDMLDPAWKDFDFSHFDIVYQVAGIAHQRETEENAHLYYEVNRDLAVEVAKKAKAAGVKRFIYMSSMSVYGLEQSDELIGLFTPTNPKTNYGWSKLQAEEKLKELEDENFTISFLRPPMVYGEGAPGNLEKLFKAVRKVHVFPTIRNERSSISVENLADGVKKVIECGYCGVVILQDSKYRCTADIINNEMAKEGVKVNFTGAFNPAIKAMIGKMDVVTKAFGNLKYEMSETQSNKGKVLFLVNHSYTIYNTRKELVKKLLDEGYEVYISSPYGDSLNTLIEWGAHYIETDFDRHGKNPLDEVKLLSFYQKIIRDIKPDFILSYTIKPNIYGSIAASRAKVPIIINITGLGTAVEEPGILQRVIIQAYKFAFKNVKTIFVQNNSNKQFFEKNNIHPEKLKLIPGSGVNIEEFNVVDFPTDEKIGFVFVSRVMKEKGIDQYLDAARYIRKKYPKTEFHICGFCEEDYKDILDEEVNAGNVIYHDWVDDISAVYRTVQCNILPTYYPEGMSNVLLESCASGRAIITTNRPGCGEIVEDGVNGYVIPSQNSEKLIEAIEKFLALSNEERKEMGLAGRRKVEKEFDRQIIVDAYMKEIINEY